MTSLFRLHRHLEIWLWCSAGRCLNLCFCLWWAVLWSWIYTKISYPSCPFILCQFRKLYVPVLRCSEGVNPEFVLKRCRMDQAVRYHRYCHHFKAKENKNSRRKKNYIKSLRLEHFLERNKTQHTFLSLLAKTQTHTTFKVR